MIDNAQVWRTLTHKSIWTYIDLGQDCRVVCARAGRHESSARRTAVGGQMKIPNIFGNRDSVV